MAGGNDGSTGGIGAQSPAANPISQLGGVGGALGVNNNQQGPFGGMYNSTNSTTTQDMMGGGGNNAPMGQTLGQLGLFGMGGQQYQQQYQQNPFGGGYGQPQMQNPFMQSSGGGFSQQQMPAYAQDYINTMNNFGGMGMGGGYGGQQDGYGGFGGPQGGYGPFGFGPNANNFVAPQGMGQIPQFSSPFSQQMQQMQPQQSQSKQLMQGQPNTMANPLPKEKKDIDKIKKLSADVREQQSQRVPRDEVERKAAFDEKIKNAKERLANMKDQMLQKDQMPQKDQNKQNTQNNQNFLKQNTQEEYEKQRNQDRKDAKAREQKRAAKRAAKNAAKPDKNAIDFSQMGKAGQFGSQGFAQGLQDYVGQQYRDYAYNPTNQTFYKSGDKKSKGTTLEQMLQQGRAAGYKMANGGIAALRRKG